MNIDIYEKRKAVKITNKQQSFFTALLPWYQLDKLVYLNKSSLLLKIDLQSTQTLQLNQLPLNWLQK